jgi:ABC-2 type transport system permease protein
VNPSIRRELTVALRSFRLPGFAVVLLFFALLDPPIVKYMNRLMEWAGAAEQIQIIMPPPTPAMALTQFLGDASGIAVIVLIFLLMGIVAGEKANGVTEWVLTRPVTRSEYLTAKIMVWGVGIVVCTLAAGAIASLYTWSLLGPVSLTDIAAALAAITAYTIFAAAATFLGSVVLNSQLAAGFTGVGVVFAGVLIKPLGSLLHIKRYLPYSLPELANQAVAGAISPVEVIPGIVCALVISFLLMVFAYRRFAEMQL